MKVKTIKKSIKTRNLLILAGVSLILVLLALWFTHHYQLWPFLPSIETTQQTQESQNNSDSTNKQDFIEGKSNDSSNDNSTIPEPTSSDITLSIRRETDGSVTIITQLKNYSDGTCDLTIKNGNETYTPPTVPVLYQASYSTCEGFNVQSNVVAHGTWQISLTVTSKGKANTNTISAEVQ